MKLCIALDMTSTNEAIELLNKIKHYDNLWIKVGLRLFVREGHHILDKIKNINSSFNIFLDLKLYDIPNTMADCAYEIAQLNLDMFNIHLSSGSKAVKEVVNVIKNEKHSPIILGVSALTSFSQDGFGEIYKQDINNCVKNWSKMGYENGLDGVVCSAHESLEVKTNTSKDFITLTPGIRLNTSDKDDQNRVASIDFAKQNKSDFIVVGRPIYQSNDPKSVIDTILKEL